MSLDPGVAQEPKGNAAGAKLSDPSEGVQVAGEPPAASLLPVQPAAGELPAPFPEAPTEIVSEAALADAQAPEDTTDEVQPDAIAIPAAVAASDVAVIPAALQPNNVPLSQAAFAAQPQLTLAGMEQVSAEQQESPAGDQPGAPVTGTAAKGATSPEVSADAAVQPFAQLARSAAAEQPQANVAAIPGGAHSGVPQAQPGAQAAVAANASTQPEPVMQFRADKAAREMGLEIARRVSSGGEELVIRLDPGELGRINIRMAVNEHGQLRAVVAADAPAVLEALRSDISELNRALEQAGVRTDSQSFRFDRGGSGDSGGQWQQRYQQQASTRHGGTGDPSVTAENNPAYRPMSTNGRVNVMA
jgi:flagellar hook-length control protein FliK